MEKEKIYQIKNPSPELLIYMIKTIPKEPINGYVGFSADGKGYEKFFDKEIYFKSCSERNVVPYSSMTLNSTLSVGSLLFGYNQKNSFQEYLSGKRVEEYLFNLSDISGMPEYRGAGCRLSTIEKSFMPSLIEKGYEISKANLWLDSYVSNARLGTHSPNILLNLDLNRVINELRLIISPSWAFSSEESLNKIPEVENWFNSFKS